MLKTILLHHLEAAKNSVRILNMTPWSTCVTVLVIAITLTLPTLFWVASDAIQRVTSNGSQGGHLSLYLTVPESPSDEAALLHRVRTTPGVAAAILISPAEGMADLQQQEGMQDIMHYLPNNPLPSVIEVTPTADIKALEQFSTLNQLFQTYPHVEQVQFDKEWINQLTLIATLFMNITSTWMIFLAIAMVLIIGNTVRMAVHSHQTETDVLTLIGASRAYIMRPFLYLGVFYGAAGTIFAVFFVNVMINRLLLLVKRLAEAYPLQDIVMGLSFNQACTMFASAVLLGWLGARLSMQSGLSWRMS